MSKIMFNDDYGLTTAVLQGRKPITRRICKDRATGETIFAKDVDSVRLYAQDGIAEFVMTSGEIKVSKLPYRVGEVVAVAQAYKDIEEYNPDSYEDVMLDQGTICESSHPYSHLMRSGGWDNKMFVRADLMPHKIRITDVRVERLQDISDEDCLKEGVLRRRIRPFRTILIMYQVPNTVIYKDTPREAFAALIDRVSRKGTWGSNPYTYAYTFKLIK